MAKPASTPPRKTTSLEQSWNAADPIPVPDAVHQDGDTAWALWNEVSAQHEARFAPTAPMTVPPTAPGALAPEARAWAMTQPAGGRAPLRPAAPRAQSPFTLEAAMLVARRNNRVCPRPVRWAEFSAMLPPRKTARGQQKPPAPVIGAAWKVTPPDRKSVV